jgi:hypothetical protein
MAVTEKITCDICGIQKGEANHWMLWKPEIALSGSHGEVGGIRFAPWHKDLYREYSHLCGEACASRLLAKSVEEWREMAEGIKVVPYAAPRAAQTMHPAQPVSSFKTMAS